MLGCKWLHLPVSCAAALDREGLFMKRVRCGCYAANKVLIPIYTCNNLFRFKMDIVNSERYVSHYLCTCNGQMPRRIEGWLNHTTTWRISACWWREILLNQLNKHEIRNSKPMAYYWLNCDFWISNRGGHESRLLDEWTAGNVVWWISEQTIQNSRPLSLNTPAVEESNLIIFDDHPYST